MKQYLSLCISLFLFSSLFSQVVVSPCAYNNPKTIVILGSSTAAGSGPSSSDSTWVNRYRKYVQGIHAQNQVINLAVGGTTTYNIMPDWFIAPSNRPVRDTTKNISEALRRGADAIIVNMPSNDAARGHNAAEQMGNFRLLKQIADSAAIPIWICTTQPRTFGASQIAIQLNTRDSVLANFGQFAIDFWNPFANSSNVINPIFDSGDGVHMNDTAHGILYQKVIAEQVLNYLADTLNYVDHQWLNFFVENPSVCGDSATVFNVVVGNFGQQSNQRIGTELIFYDHITNQSDTMQWINNSPLNGCVLDTIRFIRNTSMGVNFEMFGYLNTSDSIIQNDSSLIENYSTIGKPNLTVFHDTVCFQDSAYLWVKSDADQIFWYDSLHSMNPIASGDSLVFLLLQANRCVYVQSIRGPLHFHESLLTRSSSNVNYNGVMFNIIAKDSITIDSLSVKINSTGTLGVQALYRNGSYLGYETQSTAWTAWDIDTVSISNSGDFGILHLPTKTLAPNDTLGVYLYMQNSSAQLSYYRTSGPDTIQNSKISIPSGSGISHTFGTIYTPRNYCGEVFYHYGYNPLGDCHTDRVEVKASWSQEVLDLGNDTTISIGSSISLSIPSNYSQVLWSNGAITNTLLVDSSNFGIGTHQIWVQAIDPYGCLLSDTILLSLSQTVSVDEYSVQSITVFPNPTNGKVKITGIEEPKQIEVFDLKGKLVFEENNLQKELDLSFLVKGVYYLKVQSTNRSYEPIKLVVW